VLIFENALLYNLEGELAADAGPVDIAHARVLRPGSDVALITYGGSVPKTLEAAAALESQDVSAQVLDLRTLRPLDTDAIVTSVCSTHRVVIVDEGWRSGGISAEIMARIMEQALYELDAPVERVCTAEVPLPYSKHMEDAALPGVARIVDAALKVLGRNG